MASFIFSIALLVWLTHTKLLFVCQDLSSFCCCCSSWDLPTLVQRVADTLAPSLCQSNCLSVCLHLAINTSFMMDNKWLHSRWQIVWFCFHLFLLLACLVLPLFMPFSSFPRGGVDSSSAFAIVPRGLSWSPDKDDVLPKRQATSPSGWIMFSGRISNYVYK